MRLCFINPKDDMHGKVVVGKTKLITGTTGALLEQARAAVRHGHTVSWYGSTEDHIWEGVQFYADWSKNKQAVHDIAILWGNVVPRREAVAAGIVVADCQVFLPPVRYNDYEWLRAVQLHSEYQYNMLLGGGLVRNDQAYIIPNGIDSKIFYPPNAWHSLKRAANDKLRIVYASSPDRGLHHCFPILDKLVQEGVDIQFDVFYNVHAWVDEAWWEHDLRGLVAHQIYEGLKRPYVQYHGPVQKAELAEWYRQSDILLYPCSPLIPTETFCTTVPEAAACGCVPLISDADALGALYGTSVPILALPIHEDTWVEALLKLAKPEEREAWHEKGYAMAKPLAWYRIAKQWERAYRDLLKRFGDGKNTVESAASSG